MSASFRPFVSSARERSQRVRERFIPKRVHAPSLDWLNFLVADVRGALGPFVVVYLLRVALKSNARSAPKPELRID